MCGIAGIFNFNKSPVQDIELKRMCNVMHHRGPDDEGFYIEDNVGLGHKRLSIIDIAHGKQPMSNENGKIWVIFNGEIYNYRELRKELIQLGHKFSTQSDTEVIVHAYEEWSYNCVNHLNGMFACAIYDGEKLFLARDRLGIKPLYFTTFSNKFIFASEIKAILQINEIKPELNLEALTEYLTFQNTFGDKTWFKNIHILPPGHFLICSNNGIQLKSYWNLSYKEDIKDKKSEEEYAEELKTHFKQAVQRQLMSEVPLGTYLSGGMDTGSISAVSRNFINPLHTFTCGFEIAEVEDDEKIFDEREAASMLANYLGTQHHELILKPNDMEKVFPELIWHLEEPRVGISYQNYYINKLISKYVTVVLSGCGSDEFFGGYHWRYETILNCQNKTDFEQTYYKQWIKILSDEEKNALFLPEINNKLKDFSSFESFRKVINTCNSTNPLNLAMSFDAKTFLHGLLVVEDKLSMAHSVEIRVPFLDNELLDYILTIPHNLKLNKYLLKSAMKDLLPETILSRPKVGFIPPDKSWYKSKSVNYIKELLLSEMSLERGYFSPSYLNKILDDHLTGKCNYRSLIWSLMCFEWWNRTFIDSKKPFTNEKVVVSSLQYKD